MEALHFFTILMISFVLSIPSLFQFSWAAHIENISQTQSLIDDGSKTTLISPGQIFELGYFSPGNSKKRYLGIWYKRKPETVVWIANRNSPLNDSNGEFTIREGKLVLLNSTGSSIWSPDASCNAANGPVALLLDTGNLILKEQESAKDDAYIWQSFDYPTDTLLNGMKLGWDLTTGFERHLTSWKSADDPSTGNITYRISIISGLSQTILAVGSSRKYRSGVWNGVRFNGVTTLLVKTNFKIVSVFNETDAYIMIESTVNYSTISLVKLNYSGLLQHLVLQNDNSEWTAMYTVPTDQQCEVYNYCGANAMCTSSKYPVLCDCLEGYTPRSQEEWRALTWSKGCKRKVALDCSEGEGFVEVSGVKIPDLLEFSFNKNMSLRECKKACLKNCSCIAYANSYITKGSSGCLMWFRNLIDIRYMELKEGEEDFYIRLSASEMKSIRDTNKKKKLKVVLLASLIPGTFILCVAIWCIRRKLRKRVKGESNNEDVDLPTFDLAAIVAATNNFSPENMIGAGGFGPVYKGKLSTGQEIAVKRLSKNSRQGLKEFKNEVELIAKLQHRNLVALLGCCIQKEEMILIYEYMPNKSLDHYIFDCKRCITLPWKKHFDIIRGIARGLLYLHQDSKLRIVHRDLKASNILLDSNLDPKISDFGLARIFKDEEKEEKTRRIVGTYGYISPEYAIDGMFSVKSDVFSFGVVLLETVSGKKNRNFRHPSHNHNLLGHAWLLWNEGKALDLINPCFKDSYVEYQVLRSIQVGLLCVQKFPYNRPTMSSVVFMLENESALLPQPKQPGFFVERSSNDDFITSTTYQESYSENVATVTMPYGR